MRTWVWRLHTISAAACAVYCVLLLIVLQRSRGAECAPGTDCNPHGFLTIFVVVTGIVLAGPSLAACLFSRRHSEAGPALGLLTSILLLGLNAGIEHVPAWLPPLTWVVGGWFLVISLAGLALFRDARSPSVD
jgi:hypothetical protein